MVTSAKWRIRDVVWNLGIMGFIGVVFVGLSWALSVSEENSKKEHSLQMEKYRLSLTDEEVDQVARTVEQLIQTKRGSLVVFKQKEGEEKDLSDRTVVVSNHHNGCVVFRTGDQEKYLYLCLDDDRKILEIEAVIIDSVDPRYAATSQAYLSKPY